MKIILEFDTATDSYGDVLAQLQRSYGLPATPDESSEISELHRRNVYQWLHGMNDNGRSLIRLLAGRPNFRSSKEEVIRLLGLPTDDPRVLGGITVSINASAKKNLPRKYWRPVGHNPGISRGAYVLESDLAPGIMTYMKDES